MTRRKRLKNQSVVGNNMKAAAQGPNFAQGGVSKTLRSSEKTALFEDLARALAGSDPSVALPDQDVIPEDESNSENQTSELRKLLADVATGLWRLRKKMLPAGASEPSEDNRRPYKQLEAILDTLTQASIEIRDHTGEIVPRGGIYTLKVLAYEPTAGLSREQVIETIKPTINLKGTVIQVGEVIVGTPEIS